MRLSRSNFVSGAQAALAFALLGGVAGITVAPAAALAKEKEAPKPSYSKEFVAAAGPIQKTLTTAGAAKAKGITDANLRATLGNAAAELAAAEAVVKTSQDRIAAGQFAMQLGGWLEDSKMRKRGIKNMLDSGLLEADKVPLSNFYLGYFSYAENDWPGAVDALTKAVQGNVGENAAAEMLADAYAQQGKGAEGLTALRMAVDVRKAAGSAVPSAWYKRAQVIAYKGKLGPQAIEWSLLQVAAEPTAINFLGAGQLVREFSTFGKEESLDLGRLFLRTGALEESPKVVEREYIEYIESADPRRLPGEVLKITEAAIAKGVLKPGDMFVSDALSQSKGRVAADQASLPALERDAKTAANGKTAQAAGDAFLSYGEAAKAEEMYATAIAKGGIDQDRTLTRLGIAQVDSGKFAEAQATFAKVTGIRAPLAKLWAIHAASKAGS